MGLALLLCSVSYSNAQTTSGNLIGSTTGSWTGATYGADPGGCCASISGSGPLYDTTTNTIMFSYGQSTISQTIGLNQALGGTGLQVNGYNYNWDYRLISNSGNGGDTLTASITLKNSSGVVAETQNFSYTGAAHDTWFNESGTTTFTNPYTDPQSITLQFTGKDGGFWGGYYGPELKNISLTANYSVDPCAGNPLYSTSCPGYAEAYKELQCNANPLYDSTCSGYSSVVQGPNLASWTDPVNIATALSHSGAGITVYGFNYGFQWRRLSGKCYNSFLIFCTDYRTYSKVQASLSITNGDGTALVSKSWNYSGDGNYNGGNWNNVSGQTIFYGASYNSLNMGTIDWNKSTSNVGSIRNFYVVPLMLPDQCAMDPLSNPSCAGYAEAFLAFQCSIYTMYSPQCPGYAAALQEMLASQMAAATSTTQDTTPITTTQPTSSSTSTVAEDTEPAEVKTDVGGAELTATGEVVVSTGAPVEKKEEKKASTLPPARLLALARDAARKAEATALSVTESSIEASLSDAANPEDGMGLRIEGMRTPFGIGTDAMKMSVALASDDRARRSREESTEVATTKDSKQEDISLQQTTITASVQQEKPQTGPSVRRGGVVEGMEGGADMNALAKPPMDFNAYLTAQLRDAQFYAQKEIYKGQVNVDNARALRGLGTDRLHQEMVNQQYR